MNDSRIQQIRQEVSAASACLDDARCAIADLVADGPRLSGLDADDLGTIRLSVHQALAKVRGANAALARLEDRAKRGVRA